MMGPMLAGPLGGISVCKLEADEEEEGGGGDGEGGQRGGERQAEQPERQPEEERATREANPPLCLCLPLAGLPGSEATEAASPSWHPPGVCTSIAPGAALTINILNFLKMQNPYQPTADQRCFSEVSFCIFLIVCEQVELGCGLNGWWQAWHPGQEQPGLPGQEGHDHGASMVPGQERLCLAPACIGAGTPPASAPNIASR